MQGPIMKRPSHRLANEMDIGRGLKPQRAKIVRLQHTQNLGQSDAARTGRRHSQKFVTTIGAAQDFTFLRTVNSEIFMRDESAACDLILHDQIGRFPGIKISGTMGL